jgi:hypothetical protein
MARDLLAPAAPARKQPRDLLADQPPAQEEGFLSNLGTRFKRAASQAFDPGNIVKDYNAAGDILRIGVDAASLGGADYMAGGNQAELTKQARERMGWGGTAADVVGGYVSPVALPKKIMAGGKIAKTAWNAGESGVQGIIDAYTHNPDASWGDLAKAGATSAGLSGVVSSIADPVASFFSRRKSRSAALEALPYKNADELEAAKKAKYDQVAKSGVVYQGADAQRLATEMDKLKFSKGYDKEAIQLRKEIKRDYLSGDITPEKLDEARKYIREKAPAKAASHGGGGGTHEQMVKTIDDFGQNTPVYRPPSGPGGAYTPAPDINPVQLEARKLAQQGFKLDLVNEAKRESQRAVAKSRGNPFGSSPEQADVAQFSKLSRNIDTGKRSMTPLENSLVKRLETGTPLRNLGMQAEPWSLGGKFGGKLAVGASALHMVPGTNVFTTPATIAGLSGAEILSRAGRKTTANQIQDLEAAILDPKGIGTSAAKADPAEVVAARVRLARLAAAGGRNITNRGER